MSPSDTTSTMRRRAGEPRATRRTFSTSSTITTSSNPSPTTSPAVRSGPTSLRHITDREYDLILWSRQFEHTDITSLQPHERELIDHIRREHFSREQEAATSPDETPWYKGGIKGVRADRAFWYHMKQCKETVEDNPYGISFLSWVARFVAYTLSGASTLIVGIVLALEEAKDPKLFESHKPLMTISTAIVVTLGLALALQAFLFPPLIANTEDQYRSYGLDI